MHHIDIQGHVPVRESYRIVSPKVQEAMCSVVDRMLTMVVIKESFSRCSAPIVMTKKPNGGYRLCLDFRKLNAISKRDAYPIPFMFDILRQLRAARFISTINLFRSKTLSIRSCAVWSVGVSSHLSRANRQNYHSRDET